MSVPCHVKFDPSLWQAGGAYFVITAENMEVLNNFVFLADVSLLLLFCLVLDLKSRTRVQLK